MSTADALPPATNPDSIITPYSAEDPHIYDRLFKLNIAATVFQFVTGITVLILTKKELTYGLYSVFPAIKEGNEGGNPFGVPTANQFTEFNPSYLAGIFLLLSGLDHLLVCTVFRKKYEADLARQRNIFRWLEYSVSASIMRVMVAILSGIFDFQVLFLLFGLTMTTMLMGLAFEVENSLPAMDDGAKSDSENAPTGLPSPGKKINWLNFFLAFIPHMFAWLIIFCSFFRGVSKSDPPAFVWAIVIIIFILDLTFAINLGVQWRGLGKYKNYVYGEYVFIILSFTSKQLLCWLNFGGSNRS